MKYGELNNDINNEIVAKRIEFDLKQKQAFAEYEKSNRQLSKLQKDCEHDNAMIKHGWQGGGIYYCECSCPDCGRSGSRYIPQYHMREHNDWFKIYPEKQITLEKAIETGVKMSTSFFDNDYWWGEVTDYDNLNKDLSEKWL